MYGQLPSMTVTDRVSAGEEDEDVAGIGAESIDNHNIHFETETLEDGNGVVGGVVEDINSDAVYVSGSGSELSIPHEDSSQLTLSFRGQVYVFDSVTPEKVRLSLSFLILSLDYLCIVYVLFLVMLLDCALV